MDTAPADDGVVVDVVLEDGVLYLELANLSDRPALNVACSFEPPLVDVQGRDVSELRVFPPRRVPRTAAASAHAAGLRPRLLQPRRGSRFAVAVEYERPGEPRSETKVTHDLDLYRELAYRI